MIAVRFNNLEIHVAHACNLTCESCSHYSNQGHKGVVSLEEAERWMQLWEGRIEPQVLSLLGGEPTIHPQLPKFVDLTARYFPTSQLRLVTNGFFLHRHPTLPLAIKAHPNARVALSVHHDDPAYREKLKPVFELLQSWVREHGMRGRTNLSYTNWTRRYKGFGAEMEPFEDGQPRASWSVCPARNCVQLFEGRLWKCGPIAYLGMQNKRHGLSSKWDPYLAYQPLDATCTDDQLTEFVARRDESCCGMCPAKPERFKLPIPLRRVSNQAEPA
ncbi:MAG: radical SAM protein [Ramlibacter sp.]|nr:radical SAM protein [Ramlibacter sp.]